MTFLWKVAVNLFGSFSRYKLYEEAICRLFGTKETNHSSLWFTVGVVVISMVIVAALPLLKLFKQEQRGAAKLNC